MPNARLERILDGGHRPDIRTPELVDPLLLDFLLSRAGWSADPPPDDGCRRGRLALLRRRLHAARGGHRLPRALLARAVGDRAVSIFGLVLQDDDLRESVTDGIIDRLPVDADGKEDVEAAIEAIATPASAAGLVSLVVFLWAASGMMGALRRGLDAAMGVLYSPRSFATSWSISPSSGRLPCSSSSR